MSANTGKFRYEEVADKLKERIMAGDFSDKGKLPSEHDLADQFEVNRLTLRKAIDLLEKASLVNRHRGRGTFIGEGDFQEQTVFNYVFVGNIREHFWSEIYAALGAALQDKGLRLNAYQPSEGNNDSDFQSWLQEHTNNPAIICQQNCLQGIEKSLASLDCPKVILDITTQQEDFGYPLIEPDIRRASIIACEYLQNQGHKRIAFLGFGSDAAPVPGYYLPFSRNTAYNGYLEAMRYEGYSTKNLAVGNYGGGKHLQEELRCFIKHIGEWPTAFICQQDFKARALMIILAEEGLRVPQDVSIVSIGNTPWAEAMVPALTSIDLQPAAMARLALHALDEPREDCPKVLRIEPEIKIRDSVCQHKH